MEEQSEKRSASPRLDDTAAKVIKREEEKEAEVITGDLPQDGMLKENNARTESGNIKEEMTFECEEQPPEPPAKKKRGRKPKSTVKKAPAAASTPPASRRSSRRAATKTSYVEDPDLEIEEPPPETEEPPDNEAPMDDTMDVAMDTTFEDFDEDGELVGDDEELGPVSEFSDVEEEEEDELKPKDHSKEELSKMTPLEVFKHAQAMRQYRLARKINHLRYKEQVRQGQIEPSQPKPRSKPLPPPPEDPLELKRREDGKLRQGLRDAIKVGRMCAELVEAMLDDKGENRDQVTCKRILEDLANKPISPRAILYYPRVVGVVRRCLGPPANPEVQQVAASTLKNLQNLFGMEFAYFEELFGSMDDLDVLSQTLIKKEA